MKPPKTTHTVALYLAVRFAAAFAGRQVGEVFTPGKLEQCELTLCLVCFRYAGRPCAMSLCGLR